MQESQLRNPSAGITVLSSLMPYSLVWTVLLMPNSLVPNSLVPSSLVPDSLVPDSLVIDSLVPHFGLDGRPGTHL